MWVSFSGSGFVGFCDGFNQKPPTSEWSATAIVQGDALVGWVKGPASFGATCDQPGQPPCYTYTGSHTLSITPVPAELAVSATRWVVVPPQSVTFTAKAVPDRVGALSVPFQVLGWRWEPELGSGGAVCGTTATCTYSPTSSGTMYVDAIVNGANRTRSVHIRVICQPTGDPLLDSLPILDAMKEAEAASGDPNTPGNQTSRREHSFTVQCDASGECTHTVTDLGTPCGGIPPRVDTIPGIRAEGHIHPFFPAVPNPNGPGWDLRNPGSDSLPEECKKKPTSGTKGSQAGPSHDDFKHVESVNNGPGSILLPHYVANPDSVYVIPGGDMPSSTRQAGTKSIPRKHDSCQLL